MRVCGCCYDPDVIDHLVDTGKWTGAYIIISNDTPTIDEGRRILHLILEMKGFQWKPTEGGWYTPNGESCVTECHCYTTPPGACFSEYGEYLGDIPESVIPKFLLKYLESEDNIKER